MDEYQRYHGVFGGGDGAVILEALKTVYFDQPVWTPGRPEGEALYHEGQRSVVADILQMMHLARTAEVADDKPEDIHGRESDR
jgi:hypothetical protein